MMEKGKYKKGGGSTCAVNGCTNNRRKLSIWKESICDIHNIVHDECDCLIPFKFHVMPSKTPAKLEWIKALNRQSLPKQVFVCSEHFIDGRPTDRNPYPKLKMGYECKKTPGRRKLVRKNVPSAKLETDNQADDNSRDESEDQSRESDEQMECASPVTAESSGACANDRELATSKSFMTAGTQYQESDFLGKNDHTYGKPWVDYQHVHTQTQHADTEEKGVQVTTDPGTVTAISHIKSDSDAYLYTGVSKEVFFTLVSVMTPYNTFSFQMPIADQIMLVLMRFRLHLILDDLCRRFGISKSLTSKILSAWTPVLAEQLKFLVGWLPRETIRACCPESFRENYPRTTCIIDCAETFIQRPTILKSRGETYSNYKSHNTAKYLVGIAPHGHIMFISRSFGGRASDKFIVEKSGFLNYLLPEDEIMADRGFTIDDLLFPRRVKLNIPAFTKCKPQLSNEDLTTTRRIARVRIHVERAIRRLKCFKILSGTVPVASLKSFDDILMICAALVNLRGDLIRDNEESE